MAENKSLRPADYIQVLGLIILGAGVFLGSNYFFGSKLVFSIPIAVGIVLLLAGIVHVVATLKKAEREQQTKKLAEVVILILGYGSVAALSFLFLTHFINIEFNHKDALKEQLKNDASRISSIYNDYKDYMEEEILDSYNIKLSTKAREEKGALSTSDIDKINERINIQIDDIFDKRFSQKEKEALESEHEIKKQINSWNPILIPNQMKTLANRIDQQREWLKDKESKNDDVNIIMEDNPFNYQFEAEDVLSKLEKLQFNNAKWVLVLPVFFLLHLMILWPYFATERHRVSNVTYVKEERTTGAKL